MPDKAGECRHCGGKTKLGPFVARHACSERRKATERGAHICNLVEDRLRLPMGCVCVLQLVEMVACWNKAYQRDRSVKACPHFFPVLCAFPRLYSLLFGVA